MTEELNIIKQDDIYIIGNIGLVSMDGDNKDKGLEMMKYIQDIRPNNAAGYIGEAVYLFTIAEYEKAISVLEKSGALEAEENSDSAMALHVTLLHAGGRSEEAIELTDAYLDEGLITEQNAIQTLKDTRLIVENSIADGE